jgi:hypothetical protein
MGTDAMEDPLIFVFRVSATDDRPRRCGLEVHPMYRHLYTSQHGIVFQTTIVLTSIWTRLFDKTFISVNHISGTASTLSSWLSTADRSCCGTWCPVSCWFRRTVWHLARPFPWTSFNIILPFTAPWCHYRSRRTNGRPVTYLVLRYVKRARIRWNFNGKSV